MIGELLGAITNYGAPALFVVVAIAAIGVPLPVTLLLIITGSLASQGAIGVVPAIMVASAGAMVGDQAGYAIGRWGGHAVIKRFTKLLGGAKRMDELDAKARKWGGAGIFFSRWLVGPLGPWVNFASGMAGYSWFRFTLWDLLGESFGAVLYIWLGQVFSDRVQQIGAVSGDAGWAIIGLCATVFIGWKLVARHKPGASASL
jgi:membrane protein DedA with SNARE-associated domain